MHQPSNKWKSQHALKASWNAAVKNSDSLSWLTCLRQWHHCAMLCLNTNSFRNFSHQAWSRLLISMLPNGHSSLHTPWTVWIKYQTVSYNDCQWRNSQAQKLQNKDVTAEFGKVTHWSLSHQTCLKNVPQIDLKHQTRQPRQHSHAHVFQTARQNAEFIVTDTLCCPQTSKHLVQRMPPNSITREYVFVIIRPHLKRPAAPTQCNTNEVLLM